MTGEICSVSSNLGKQNQLQKDQPHKFEKHSVHWFRKGLRLHDNPAFCEGIRGSVSFRCVFVIDPWFAGSSNVGINKWRFLLQCLDDLDQNLRKLNSRLFVIRGQPADALPKLFKEWGTTCLTFEEDPEPYGKVRDHNITQLCKELGIEVVQTVSHTLYKLDQIIEKNGGRAPLTYNQFQAIIASMDPPPMAQPAVVPSLLENSVTPTNDDHDEKYGVPTLDELGFDTEYLRPPIWIGGETEALTRLERHLERKAWVASFGRPKMTPQSLLASPTGLSPYLRFGCLSTRLFYHQLTDLYKKIKKACPPLSLHGQLLWREFFYCAATKNGNFDRMEGNSICVQIPWDRNAEALAKWANGQTGFPWIDAIMTQLREEGWIHHLARHAVACFLTRGDLWVSWEEGMKVFEELLLDADWSVNAGMWMWLSCSSFFQQFFHCYCPVRFGRKADPNGDYIRRYLPVLRNFPTRYIHEPWNAPESVQRTAKCIIGKDYSLPMVNHAVASRTNMERMKQVYQQLAKYRCPGNIDEQGKNNMNIARMFLSAKDQRFPVNMSTPSPTAVIAHVNNSGAFMCQQIKSDTIQQPLIQQNDYYRNNPHTLQVKSRQIQINIENSNYTNIENQKKNYLNTTGASDDPTMKYITSLDVPEGLPYPSEQHKHNAFTTQLKSNDEELIEERSSRQYNRKFLSTNPPVSGPQEPQANVILAAHTYSSLSQLHGQETSDQSQIYDGNTQEFMSENILSRVGRNSEYVYTENQQNFYQNHNNYGNYSRSGYGDIIEMAENAMQSNSLNEGCNDLKMHKDNT